MLQFHFSTCFSIDDGGSSANCFVIINGSIHVELTVHFPQLNCCLCIVGALEMRLGLDGAVFAYRVGNHLPRPREVMAMDKCGPQLASAVAISVGLAIRKHLATNNLTCSMCHTRRNIDNVAKSFSLPVEIS